MRKFLLMSAAMAAALAASAGPASAQDRWDWDAGDRDYRLIGPGVPHLFPELRRTSRGRAFVMRNFDRDRDGRVGVREAEAANRAFAAAAGPRRGRFDWEGRGRNAELGERGGRVEGRADSWDRAGMRAYNFRQTPQGARMTMQEDVLFATDSDVLRPAAIQRLRPLAGYLRANPRGIDQGPQGPRRGAQAPGHVYRRHRRRLGPAPHGLRGRRQRDRRGAGRPLRPV
jgi:flagellar motor protein MotB